MDYTRFIRLAHSLKNDPGQDPAAIRSAVSRIYYGVMHKALDIIERLDKPVIRGTGHHQFVQKVLMNCGHSELKLAGSMMKDMHNKRCDADYKIENATYENINFAESVFLIAEDICEILDRCLASEDVAEIKVGIANYRRILRQ
jgi:uncharacterized protein (UPF0332 family)